MKYYFALIIVLVGACGTAQHQALDYLYYTGSVQVLAAGTRSETVVFEDSETGERFALVNELARELVQQSGMPIAITAVLSEEGWSVDPDIRKLRIIEYAVILSDEDQYE